MEGVLSNITISEFFPTTMLDEQQAKKIKLQNSSYNNITEKYKRESEKDAVSEFSKPVSPDDVAEQAVPANEPVKEAINLPAVKDIIELVRYQEATPIQVGEYRPIKISTSMEANIVSKYSVDNKENEIADNYRINFSDTDILFKANKKYMDVDSENTQSNEEVQDVVVAPERDEYYHEDIHNDYVNDEDIKPTDEEVYKEESENSYDEESNSEQNNVEADNDDKNSDSEEDYGKLIEKLKQERDAAAQRAKVASSNYNETKVKLAEAADKYVAILKEQTATLNHEAESSEQKASDCKEQLETMLEEINKVKID